MAKNKTVSILGCGWLGLPVAENLLATGYSVKGSTTSPAKLDLLTHKGIEPFLVNLTDDTPPAALPAFLQADYLIISFPPGLRAGKGEKYLEQIKVLTRAIATAPVQKILFISSTSVYPDFNRVVTESENLRPYLSHNILLQAEDLISSLPGKSTTILRMSGLVGGSRHPGRFLAGKQNVPNPTAPVNLIHLDDCVNIIAKIFGNNDWG